MCAPGEYEIRPYKRSRGVRRGEPRVHPEFSDNLTRLDPGSISNIISIRNVCEVSRCITKWLKTKIGLETTTLKFRPSDLLYLDRNRSGNMVEGDKELEELFSLVTSISWVRHAVVGYFQRFRSEHRHLIEKGLQEDPGNKE